MIPICSFFKSHSLLSKAVTVAYISQFPVSVKVAIEIMLALKSSSHIIEQKTKILCNKIILSSSN